MDLHPAGLEACEALMDLGVQSPLYHSPEM